MGALGEGSGTGIAHRIIENTRDMFHRSAIASGRLADGDLAVGKVGHLADGRGEVERGFLPPLRIDPVKDERHATAFVRHVYHADAVTTLKTAAVCSNTHPLTFFNRHAPTVRPSTTTPVDCAI